MTFYCFFLIHTTAPLFFYMSWIKVFGWISGRVRPQCSLKLDSDLKRVLTAGAASTTIWTGKERQWRYRKHGTSEKLGNLGNAIRRCEYL